MRTHHAIKSLLVLFAALAVVSLPARTLADMNVYFGNLHCVFHAMTAGDFRSRRRTVSGQGGG